MFFSLFMYRKIIIDGCVAFAKRVGGTRIEAELLPQCWEQVKINYKKLHYVFLCIIENENGNKMCLFFK